MRGDLWSSFGTKVLLIFEIRRDAEVARHSARRAHGVVGCLVEIDGAMHNCYDIVTQDQTIPFPKLQLAPYNSLKTGYRTPS